MKRIFSTIISILFITNLMAQNNSASNIRTGWTFGVLPSVAFDADLGFQYGALTNVYYFGDGAIYPEYYHSFYAEAAYTTKKYGLFRLSYDSKYLIPNHRLSVDLTYLPDAMCDFLGFNGYQSRYNHAWTQQNDANYVSRGYYKMQRDLFRFSADLQGNLSGHLYWNGGIGILSYSVNRINLDRLNRGSDDEDKIPDIETLYDKYVRWGLISESEKNGGSHPYLHAGLTYDTRDRQQNPQKGFHADAFLTYTAGLGELSDYQNLKFNASWRHYVTLIPHRLTLAYRLGTQLNVAGKSPFYINTYLNQLYMQRVIYEGLGGANSVRGILRNRILADGVVFANVELRAQLFSFKIGKENFYIGINPFIDGGMVAQEREIETSNITPSELVANFDTEEDGISLKHDQKPHLSGGCGLKVAMNDNFVLSVDWATAFDKQDNGKISNLYIKMGYMF